MSRQGICLVLVSILAVCTPSIMAQCNAIDAVTSASFRITGGQACPTYANLNWTYNESNGTMTIRWGISTTYGSQKSVYAAKPINITGLTPSTKYFYAVDGFYQNRSYAYTRSSFTTSGGVAILGPSAPAAAAKSIRIANTRLTLPSDADGPLFVELFTLKGTSVSGRSSLSTKATNAGSGFFQNAGSGVYMAKISWKTGTLRQKIVIGD